MLGLGAAAVAVGPAVMRALAAVPSCAPEIVTPSYDGLSNINRYFLARKNKFQDAILRHLWENDPYAGLVSDGSYWRETPGMAQGREEFLRGMTAAGLHPGNPMDVAAYGVLTSYPGFTEAGEKIV